MSNALNCIFESEICVLSIYLLVTIIILQKWKNHTLDVSSPMTTCPDSLEPLDEQNLNSDKQAESWHNDQLYLNTKELIKLEYDKNGNAVLKIINEKIYQQQYNLKS